MKGDLTCHPSFHIWFASASEKAGRGRGVGTGEGGFLLHSLASPSPQITSTYFSLSNGNLFEVLFGVAGIISQFGGELDLQSTIADGADICKIRFRRPNVDIEPKVKKVK